MIGTSANSAASRAAPSSGWRNAITSAYFSTTRTVSARFSPFLTEAISASANPMAEPPSLCMAASKLSLVRVLGSKNSVASIFPRSMSEPLFATGSIALTIFRR